ncbi:MAG: hypothetical protein ABR936_11955 [Bacteroidota bacterium]|jgi:hypothetical protein
MSTAYINTITANSTPVYGVFFDYWDQDDWIQWHKALVVANGIALANQIFIKAWNASPWYAKNLDFRDSLFPSNAVFIAYAKANNFYNDLFSGFIGTIVKSESTVVDTTGNLATGIGNLASGFDAVATYLIPALAVIGIVFAIFYFKKHKLT